MGSSLKCKSVLITAILMFLCAFGSVVYGQPWDGNGDANDPYQIWTAEDMQAIGADANYWDAHFKLMADIDLGAYTGTSFNIIGTDWDNSFTGVFDGGGHTISNFTYDLTYETDYLGLFGYVGDPNAEIKNLGLIDPNVSTGTADGYLVGSLVGVLGRGTMEDCYVEGGNISGHANVGGLVGQNNSTGSILNCHSATNVTGNEGCVGGLVGLSGGVISGCYTTGNVTGEGGGWGDGGLVGYMYTGSISDCYSTGEVTGEQNVGGLVGCNDHGNITGCYATGSVEATGSGVGGLVGYNQVGHILDCNSTSSVTGGEYCVGGLVGQNDYDSSISNSYSEGIVAGKGGIGGLVGGNGGDITGSYSSSSVTGSDGWVGGLVGDNWYGSISDCYSEGSAAGEDRVGGLVGRNYYGGTVSDCYSLCSVDGNDSVGGLVGLNEADSNVINCYSAGSVTGDSNVGGLVGNNDDSTVDGSFWDVTSSGLGTSDGGVGLTTSQMQDKGMYFLWGCEEQVWTIDDGIDYPRLLWEGKPGEVIDFGCGTETEPHLIYEAAHMQIIGGSEYSWDRHFRLVADIDMSGYTGTSYNIIGDLYYDSGWVSKPFTGVFDGGGHTISNFTYSSTHYEESVGLFGHIEDPNAEIRDLGLTEPDVNAGYSFRVGALAGNLSAGTVTNCYVEGGSVTGDRYVGGLIGGGSGESASVSDCHFEGSVTGKGEVGGLMGRFGGIISNCSSAGSVTGEDYEAGGLVGFNYHGHITNCYSTCSVTVGEHYAGGLVGYNYDEASIINSYSTGDVTGSGGVGGLVGDNDHGSTISRSFSTGDVTGYGAVGGLVGENRSSISECYSTGSVSGNDYVGGLVGRTGADITIVNCYSTGSVTGIGDDVGGLVGLGHAKNSYWDVNSSGMSTSYDGVGLTTGEMQSKGTYLFWGCGQETWRIDDGNDYPRLLWEGKPGEVIEDFGCGTAEEPYLVYEAVHMQIIGGDEWNWDKHYKLMADIDLGAYTGTSFNIIGNVADYYTPFTGVFDGNGHTISNFTYDCNGVGDIGLFGYIDDPNAEIKNLGLIEPDVNAGDCINVGSLIGRLRDGTVTNCYVEGGSVTGDRGVGGLIGDGADCNVLKCYSTCSVTGGDRGIGGLVGSGGNISNSYSSSSVTGNEDVGGLVGRSRFNISNSYSSGSVTGGDHVGGLVGYSWSVVFNCYSSGSVAGDSNVGGLIGYDYNLYGDYTASFWDSDVNPDVNGIGNIDEPNVVGLPTALMQTESTFTDAGWDFVGEVINGTEDIWDICEGTNYPKLVWSIPAGDFICPDGVDMIDFAVLGEAWFSDPNMGNWEAGCDISEPNDNVIDGLDLGVFVGNWLCN